MKSAALLDHYLHERTLLLKTISEFLARYPRVKAAWLFGSMGRGDEDALSDIDLWVIVDSEIDRFDIRRQSTVSSRAYGPPTVIKSLIDSKVLGPIPGTFSISSIDLKAPFCSR